MPRPYLLVLIIALSSCAGGAVVFAPTPPPPDLSPLLYTHPSGVFSVAVPRNWPVYVQNTTQMAAASFAVPGHDEPSLRFAVMNLGERADSAGLREFIDQYQTIIRPDVAQYTEANRGAMGDGSWRLTGLRTSAGGLTQQMNTFIQQSGTLMSVIEVLMPDDTAQQAEFQSIINTFAVHPEATLEPAEATVLAFATPASLSILHVSSWSTPAGVFFITGEVGNYGTVPVSGLPIRAVLRNADGLTIAEDGDLVMGYTIPPGGFAPFSIRFGGGQPALASQYEIILGGVDWTGDSEQTAVGQDALKWTDSSTISADGHLAISGRVTNGGASNLFNVRAVATVFDTNGDVIAAGFTDVSSALAPDAAADFQILVPEIGGVPANYIVNIQALP